MAQYELVGIAVSVLGVIVAARAFSYKKHANDELRKQNQELYRQEKRAAVATQLAPYNNILFEVKKQTEPSVKALSSTARDALNKILILFDKYGASHDGRPPRHICHNICELIYLAFKGQLVWQKALNLVWRFQMLRYAAEDLELEKREMREVRKRACKEVFDFESWHLKNPNENLENRLKESATFVLLLEELRARIPEDARRQFLDEGVAVVNEYRRVFQEHSCVLEDGYKRLRDGWEKNKHEEFSLGEASRLGRHYAECMSKLEVLNGISSISLGEAPTIRRPGIAVEQLVCDGALLYMIQVYDDWGSGLRVEVGV